MKMDIRILLFIFLLPSLLVAQNWEADYGLALEKASTKNKPLILVFAGSDWCAPCIKLDKQIWQSDDFIEYANEHYVLYKADFPRKKANQLNDELALSNRKLAEKFNPKGYFPLVVVLYENQTVLGRAGYKRIAPKAYITMLNALIK